MRFEKSHPLYMENHKRQYSKNGMPESSLKYYLKTSDGFLGEVKAKKFAGHSKMCWAFDMDVIGLNLPLSALADAETVDNFIPTPAQNISRAQAEQVADMVGTNDVPF